jgi:purine-binding chemotaxis protein CheW
MVDLVKIRKKAKKVMEAVPAVTPSGSEGPGGRGGTQQPPTPDPLSNDTPSTAPPPGSLAPARDDSSATQDSALSTQDSKLARFKAGAGKRREHFMESEVAVESGQLLELLTFHIAGEQYALDIEHIVEIVTPREATRVPNADASVVGIISLRGTIVTVVDVRRTLHHPPSGAPGPDTRVVVVQYGGETIGFEVDRVLRVVKVERGEVEPHPVVHASEQSEAIRGVFRQANALTILLDFDKLLAARLSHNHGTHL